MPKRLALLLVVALTFVACYGDEEEPAFPFATVLLDNGDETTLLTVEVAETDEQHELGLSGRDSLEEDRGMVFVFFEERQTGFWMKDTEIPLSIAFFDDEGTIVDILDMKPCEKDPCKHYVPDAPYMGALEVNQGSFEDWDVSEGDKVRLTR